MNYRGSLVARLHNLVSSQAGHVRLWHHRSKRSEFENIILPCVILCVLKVCTSFSRYFIQCRIKDDDHGLLKDCSNHKFIVIMLVPDGISSPTDINSQSIIKIYPPWDVLEQDRDIIRVTYFKIISSSEIEQVEIVEDKQIVSKEFDCMCIERNRLNPLCPSKLEKPDVMKHLFNF